VDIIRNNWAKCPGSRPVSENEFSPPSASTLGQPGKGRWMRRSLPRDSEVDQRSRIEGAHGQVCQGAHKRESSVESLNP
jgi:hypothetical protein